MALNENPAALATRTGPKDLSFDGDTKPHSQSRRRHSQAILSPFRRLVAEGCFRLAAVKLVHAADNIAIGDDHAAWPDIDCAESHCIEATSLLLEEECGAV